MSGHPSGTGSRLCSPITSYNVDSKSCSILKQVSTGCAVTPWGDTVVGHPQAVPCVGAVRGMPLGGL